MFCSNCGYQIPNEAAFCPKCGTKVEQTGAANPTNEPKIENADQLQATAKEFAEQASIAAKQVAGNAGEKAAEAFSQANVAIKNAKLSPVTMAGLALLAIATLVSLLPAVHVYDAITTASSWVDGVNSFFGGQSGYYSLDDSYSVLGALSLTWNYAKYLAMGGWETSYISWALVYGFSTILMVASIAVSAISVLVGIKKNFKNVVMFIIAAALALLAFAWFLISGLGSYVGDFTAFPFLGILASIASIVCLIVSKVMGKKA